MDVNPMGLNNLKNQLQNARMMGLTMACPHGKCDNCPAHMKNILFIGGNPQDLTKCKMRYITNELQKLMNLIENED